jgi:hypothetical protein
MTGGAGAVARATSDTISGTTALPSRQQGKNRQKLPGKSRILMMRKRPSRIGPLPASDTTGGAGHPRRSSKNGRAIYTVSNNRTLFSYLFFLSVPFQDWKTSHGILDLQKGTDFKK